jgi:DNA-binding transcriptional regulator YhcF (GntR family)
MKYNFTDDVRLALAAAREEAIRMRHDYVGTEHLLLGLVRLDGFLPRFGLDPAQVTDRVESSVRRGKSPFADLRELPYTSRAKKVLEYSMASARDLGNSYVGAEHLLIGVLREEKGIGAQVLASLGLDADGATRLVMRGREPAPDQTSAYAGEDPETPGFTIELDDTSTSSIYEQIIDRVREAVATGKLRPGQKLPPVRRLADELDIAPGTVARAYAELERLGVVVTEGARGTRVAEERRNKPASDERLETLAGLLRPVAVAAFHMGGTATELRAALESAMKGILEGGTDTPQRGGRG